MKSLKHSGYEILLYLNYVGAYLTSFVGSDERVTVICQVQLMWVHKCKGVNGCDRKKQWDVIPSFWDWCKHSLKPW